MMIIDRNNRDRLATEIRRYLAGEIRAFEFDSAVDQLLTRTDDPTVGIVAMFLWQHYDDLKDHSVVLSQEQWDYFHRLLLILDSNSHIVIERRLLWKPPQLVAAIGLLLFLYLAFQTGFGNHLLLMAIPFGLLSMGLTYWGNRQVPVADAHGQSLYPFSSFQELSETRREVSHFVKQRYPKEIATRRIRSRTMEMILWFQCHAIWLMFAPVALLFQSLPFRREKVCVCGSH